MKVVKSGRGRGDGTGARGHGHGGEGQRGKRATEHNVKNPKKLRGKGSRKRRLKNKINFFLGGTWF